MSERILIPGGGGGKGFDYFREAGTTDYECWYPCGFLTHTTTTGGGTAPTADRIYLFPFPSGRGGRVDRIGCELTSVGGANSKVRLGIYQSLSDKRLKPDKLLLDSGEIACNSGSVKTATVSVVLPANKLLWGALTATGGGGTMPSFRLVTSMTPTIFGFSSAFGASASPRGWTLVTQTYGALPDPCPSAGTLQNTGANYYLIALRYDQ
jgi:hypothetical protein